MIDFNCFHYATNINDITCRCLSLTNVHARVKTIKCVSEFCDTFVMRLRGYRNKIYEERKGKRMETHSNLLPKIALFLLPP